VLGIAPAVNMSPQELRYQRKKKVIKRRSPGARTPNTTPNTTPQKDAQVRCGDETSLIPVELMILIPPDWPGRTKAKWWRSWRGSRTRPW
jgi:hypothetical protein